MMKKCILDTELESFIYECIGCPCNDFSFEKVGSTKIQSIFQENRFKNAITLRISCWKFIKKAGLSLSKLRRWTAFKCSKQTQTWKLCGVPHVHTTNYRQF
jgi:hypothetical protein